MKRAVFPMTDEEREGTVEHDKVLLARVLAEIAPRGDMEQMPEPENETRQWNPISVVVFAYAGVICFVLGWIAAERFF